MKRWAFITVFLYGALLLVLTVPLALVSFIREDNGDVFAIYSEWGYWIWIGILLLAQVLLLIVPVNLSRRKMVSRRKLIVPVITSAFLIAIVLFSGIFSILAAIWGDDVLDFHLLSQEYPIIDIVFITLILWSVWSVVFWRFRREDEDGNSFDRLIKWLLRGSILELLVAVPSHVFVRQRDDCCAPAITFWGITTGLSVMLMAFGPAVFFLFAKRFGRLKPKAEKEPEAIDDKQE